MRDFWASSHDHVEDSLRETCSVNGFGNHDGIEWGDFGRLEHNCAPCRDTKGTTKNDEKTALEDKTSEHEKAKKRETFA